MDSVFCIQFGWEGDGGVGEMLIAQTLAGVKTATCTFERPCTDEEVAEIYRGEGRVVPVLDKHGRLRAHVRILRVFETTFGDPDRRLVEGEGDGADVEKFKADHRAAWEATMPGVALTDEEVMIVELFEFVSPAR